MLFQQLGGIPDLEIISRYRNPHNALSGKSHEDCIRMHWNSILVLMVAGNALSAKAQKGSTSISLRASGDFFHIGYWHRISGPFTLSEEIRAYGVKQKTRVGADKANQVNLPSRTNAIQRDTNSGNRFTGIPRHFLKDPIFSNSRGRDLFRALTEVSREVGPIDGIDRLMRRFGR